MVRVLSGSETLSDYAKANPEIAYATPEKQPTPAEAPAEVNTPIPTEVPSEAPGAAKDFISLAEETTGSTHYADGFFYQPLTDAVISKITGISYPVAESIAPALAVTANNIVSDDAAANLGISYDDLCYMQVLHYDFNGEIQIGELICNRKIADDFMEIFHELYVNEYQIEKIRLVDEYGGDDTASMMDNNTSCFNYRVVDGTSSLSKHAIGCAIDINPFYNPYVVFNKNGSGETYISPEGSEIYADRSQSFPHKIDENDLCYKLFKEHGFVWGGDWNSCKDYQHFQKVVE
ncbi:MAG: M15 family metallopeptidase [Lachnospiraceae bacterium]|nr:M15 family metallopeptidase [Lachnospiraceae bacterium]